MFIEMKKTLNHLLLFVCLCGCSSHKNTADKELPVTDSATTGSSAKQAINKDSVNYPVEDSTLHISLDKKNSAKIIYGKLEGKAQVIQLYIDNRSADTLHVLIEPSDQDANIRLNQIIYPDGRADGPFGRDEQFVLKNAGQYQLVIGNNLMAEGRRSTAFKLHLSIH
jgi:hypothetical protein